MQSKSCPIPLFSKTDRVLVNEVNTLDDSFSTLDFREELPKFWSLLTNVNLDRKMVEKLLLGVKQRVIPGPDGIGGRVLENYAPRFFFLRRFHIVTVSSQGSLSLERRHYFTCAKNTAPQSLMMMIIDL